MSLRVFHEQVRARGEKAVRYPPPPPRDLTPPQQVGGRCGGWCLCSREGQACAQPGCRGSLSTRLPPCAAVRLPCCTAPPPPATPTSPPCAAPRPPHAQLLEGAAQLAELVECYEGALHAEGEPAAAAEQAAGAGGSEADSGAAVGPVSDFGAVLSAVADPLVEMCVRSSEALNPNSSSR